MNMNEYQQLASRTAPKEDKSTRQLANYALGLAGEAGETVDYLKKIIFHKHDFDKENLKKELGDVLWYVSQVARVADIEMDDIATSNIEKLKKRYPEGFSSSDSINRVE